MAKEMTFNEFSDFFSKVPNHIDYYLEETIDLCCEKVRSDIDYEMAHTPRDTTKTYYTQNKTKGHHPSLPNNPPAPDTGNLRNSIRYEVHNEGREIYGIVGSSQLDENYAVYTEYGTTSGGWGGKGMAPRPWLRPAMLKNDAWIRSSIAKAIAKGFKSAAEWKE